MRFLCRGSAIRGPAPRFSARLLRRSSLLLGRFRRNRSRRGRSRRLRHRRLRRRRPGRSSGDNSSAPESSHRAAAAARLRRVIEVLVCEFFSSLPCRDTPFGRLPARLRNLLFGGLHGRRPRRRRRSGRRRPRRRHPRRRRCREARRERGHLPGTSQGFDAAAARWLFRRVVVEVLVRELLGRLPCGGSSFGRLASRLGPLFFGRLHRRGPRRRRRPRRQPRRRRRREARGQRRHFPSTSKGLDGPAARPRWLRRRVIVRFAGKFLGGLARRCSAVGRGAPGGALGLFSARSTAW